MADSSASGKNFIITGVVLGLAAAAAGYYVSSQEKPSVSLSVSGKSNVAKYAQDAKALYDAATKRDLVADVAPSGAWVARDKVGGKKVEGHKVPRYAPIFFAPKLYLVSVSPNKAEVRDLMGIEDPEKPDVAGRLHKEVPNDWFFRYGLDNVIGDGDVLSQDPDGDGFTNLEEFKAGTDPSDANSYPAFAGADDSVKMVVKSRKAYKYMLSCSMFTYTPDDFVITVRAENASDVRNTGMKEGAEFGLTLGEGSDRESKKRFKVVSIKGSDDKGPFADIEDTYTKNEAARKFIIRPGSKAENMHELVDTEVTFVLTAGSKKGTEVPGIQVGQSFAVPGFEGTECTLVEAKRGNVVVKVGEKTFKVPQKSKK